MQIITSVKNPLIKFVTTLHSRKGRDENGLFVVEGLKMIHEAISAGLEVNKIFYNKDFSLEDDFLKACSECYPLTFDCMKKISTTSSPVNVLAIVKKFQTNISFLTDLNAKDFIVILDGISDPGNLGTVIRTSCAAMADCVILTGHSLDIFNPKVVRSTAGTLWNIPIYFEKSEKELVEQLRSSGFSFIVADAKGDFVYSEFDYKQKVAIVFGSEAHGVSDCYKKLADNSIRIPISDKVESLNLSVALGLVLFEAKKQKGI